VNLKIAATSLTLLAAVAGFFGAYYWMRSAMVHIAPPGPFEPVEEADKANFWNAALMDAFQNSALLNKKAAGWTAASVLFAAFAGLVQLF
jgi:hypothetical protein